MKDEKACGNNMVTAVLTCRKNDRAALMDARNAARHWRCIHHDEGGFLIETERSEAFAGATWRATERLMQPIRTDACAVSGHF